MDDSDTSKVVPENGLDPLLLARLQEIQIYLNSAKVVIRRPTEDECEFCPPEDREPGTELRAIVGYQADDAACPADQRFVYCLKTTARIVEKMSPTPDALIALLPYLKRAQPFREKWTQSSFLDKPDETDPAKMIWLENKRKDFEQLLPGVRRSVDEAIAWVDSASAKQNAKVAEVTAADTAKLLYALGEMEKYLARLSWGVMKANIPGVDPSIHAAESPFACVDGKVDSRESQRFHEFRKQAIQELQSLIGKMHRNEGLFCDLRKVLAALCHDCVHGIALSTVFEPLEEGAPVEYFQEETAIDCAKELIPRAISELTLDGSTKGSLDLAGVSERIAGLGPDVTFAEDLRKTWEEIEICFDQGCFIAAISLCGKVLEICLKCKIENIGAKYTSDAGINKLFNELKREMSNRNDRSYLDPSLKNIVELVALSRNGAVHAREKIPVPSKDQASTVIYATKDMFLRTFST